MMSVRGNRHGYRDDHDDGHIEIMIDLVRKSKCIADDLDFEGSGFDPWEKITERGRRWRLAVAGISAGVLCVPEVGGKVSVGTGTSPLKVVFCCYFLVLSTLGSPLVFFDPSRSLSLAFLLRPRAVFVLC